MNKLLVLPVLLISAAAAAEDFRCMSLAGLSHEDVSHKIDVLHVELDLMNDHDAEAQRAFLEPICRSKPWSKFSDLLKSYYVESIKQRNHEEICTCCAGHNRRLSCSYRGA